ncbi:leptin receptor gene-related protein isoform X1 [Nomia melanderi]|uniref:leptin receptor gene-related protein isoform X1 n=2 Tax=Nomia melanderi TaxID=2448451 RepID=UPI001303F9DC|nr:leptin receptor gene-related protein isoform X2 [Nomia melanderi]
MPLNVFINKQLLLAFSGSIGMTFVILGCALPTFNKVWWPFFVVLFYALAPVPTIIARRCTHDNGNASNPCLELAIFITMGFLVSSFALPIVLARSPATDPVIQWAACYLTLAGNIVVYLTLVGFFITFEQEDVGYNAW